MKLVTTTSNTDHPTDIDTDDIVLSYFEAMLDGDQDAQNHYANLIAMKAVRDRKPSLDNSTS